MSPPRRGERREANGRRGLTPTVARLDVGDVAIGDHVLVERKTIADLVAAVLAADERSLRRIPAIGRVTARRVLAAGAGPARPSASAADGP